jgi:hypothetical protein
MGASNTRTRAPEFRSGGVRDPRVLFPGTPSRDQPAPGRYQLLSGWTEPPHEYESSRRERLER